MAEAAPEGSFGELLRAIGRDIALSFCPAETRRRLRPESALWVFKAATWTGIVQGLLFAIWLARQYHDFLVMRARQMESHLAGSNPMFQTAMLGVVTLEFLGHPTSLLLLYFTLEGFIRFLGSLIFEAVVPSLPVALMFRMMIRREDRKLRQVAEVLPRDTFERLPDGIHIRICSAAAKPWTHTFTIGIGEQWYQSELQEEGTSQRPWAYLLSPVPPGRVLRGFERYQVEAALEVNPDRGRPVNVSAATSGGNSDLQQ